MKKTPIIALCLLIITMTLVHNIKDFKRNPAGKFSKSKTLFLGVDGLSRKYFDFAQKEMGLFKSFKNISTHIAPYPSISDYSWNKIVHSKDLYGQKGRIKNYEAAYYDPSKNTVINDTREYFRRIGQESHYYSGAFQIFLNPYIESLMYTPSTELPKFEFEYLKSEIISKTQDPFTSAFVASIDAIAHTQADLLSLVTELDKFISELTVEHANQGIELKIIMISDHGQDFNFQIGEDPSELLIADVVGEINKVGFHVKSSLQNSNDIAAPIMALGSYVPLYFKDLAKREKLIENIKAHHWFEHAIYVKNKTNDMAEVIIHDQKGFSALYITKQYNSFLFKYNNITSNALKVPNSLLNSLIEDTRSLELQKQSEYPDSFYRIAQAVFEDESHYPDMIINLKNQYRVKGDLDQFTKMFRTHGSLSKDASEGIVVNNYDLPLPTHMRTDDILTYLNIKPEMLYQDNLDKGLLSNNLSNLGNHQTISTGAREFGGKRVFGLLNRFINYSQYVLDVSSIESFSDIFKMNEKTLLTGENASSIDFDFSKVEKAHLITPSDVATMIDLTLRNPDWKVIEKDPKFVELKNRIQTELAKLGSKPQGHTHQDIKPDELIQTAAPYAHAAKTLVMKDYSLPFLFKRALSFPEFEKINDYRNKNFAKDIIENKYDFTNFNIYSEEEINPHESNRLKTSDAVKKLLEETFKERKIIEEIYPHNIKTLYNFKDEKDITFVYIPGIYNSIFNNEIFAIGIDALKNNFGLRVISAPTISSCDSEINGEVIINFIKDDIKYRKTRGRSKHKYFLLGYSKGAVDALYGLNQNQEFSKENIIGLTSIASPIQGSSILSKTDVPLMLLELITNENIPKTCRDEHWASKSITTEAANRFFTENEKNLAGLIRYFSVSFKSNINESHIWMRATKQIAQFDEENDGVVALSASKFPESLKAVDLGVIEADHLAGIVASDFPQGAFFESLLITLQKIGAFEENAAEKWNEYTKYNSPHTEVSSHQKEIKKMISPFFNDKVNLSDLKISKKKLNQMKERIISRLSSTPYKIEDFDITLTRSGKVLATYELRGEDSLFLGLFQKTEDAEINSMDNLVDFLLSKVQASGHDLTVDNTEIWRTYPISDREKIKLPESSISYLSDFRINVRNIPDFMEKQTVPPMLPSEYKDGINIIYDHRRVEDFREEYQLNFETTSTIGADNNAKSGWISTLTNEGEIVGKMSSDNSSIRLSTFAMRFFAKDFKNMDLKIQVNNDVPGANVLFGGSGNDDSAFQVWFTIRENTAATDRSKFTGKENSVIFGYYFGDKIPGKDLKDGEIYENYYSKKNFIIAVLPEAKQILLSHGPENLNKPHLFNRNIYNDLKRAFPKLDTDHLEIVGITFQHDSNDSKDDSEAFFKYLKFRP